MTLPFVKLQAAGNGYVAVDGRDEAHDWSALARSITQPNFGVGSDGLVVACRSTRAPICMRVFNSDGSEAEMSGNGLRLFAKFVLDAGLVAAGPVAAAREGLRVETAAGLRTVWPTLDGGRMVSGRIAMGEPRFSADALPFDAHLAGGAERLVDYELEMAGRRLCVTCLSIGNPHAVLFLDESVDDFPLERVGPAVQTHALFPNRVNFEVVNVVDRTRLRARIFERGEGETLASGTGSTACVVAARVRGLVDERVTVELRGGELAVEWDGAGEAFLEGPVEEVFRGEWPSPG